MSAEWGADEIIDRLGLAPHPEGGHYAETWRADAAPDERAAGTAIYFLLKQGEQSHWHRIDSAEIWHWYAGDPLELKTGPETGPVSTHILGNALADGERPQVIVPPGHWQSARSLGAWSLVGCTVSPGFSFAHFELAPADWSPAG